MTDDAPLPRAPAPAAPLPAAPAPAAPLPAAPAPDAPLPFAAILRARLDRRAALRHLAALTALPALAAPARAEPPAPAPPAAPPAPAAPAARPTPAAPSTLTFPELPHGADAAVHVARGYTATVLLRWGDPLFPDAPPFDPARQTPAAQRRQLGTECDYLAFFPLPPTAEAPERGLLCINHEDSTPELMFPGLRRDDAFARTTRAEVEVEIAALGHSVVELARTPAGWRPVPASHYTRRLTGDAPLTRLAGPAAGHRRLRTRADPAGRHVAGVLNCCSGGTTPWGTVLIGEENTNQYFHGDPAAAGAEARNHHRMRIGIEETFPWHLADPRFDIAHEPNEPNRYGWVVELDPHDPTSTPTRRTALGRFKHEGATCVVDPDGRVVVYLGDDDEDEFVYRFVTRGRHDPAHPDQSRDLLDDGTLSAARFESDGTLRWLPLVFGQGPLTPANGFHDPGDVVIEARHAATLLGATPMDRPEDIEPHPHTGAVYVMLTKNKHRPPERCDAANPRPQSLWGHVIELTPPRDANGHVTHAADAFRWEVFLTGGDPHAPPEARGRFHPATSDDGWLSCPDNCTFDPAGRLWIATDGMSRHGLCNGLYAMDTHGPGRALPRHFFRAPLGAEVAGPCFTPDGRTRFLSIQHPGQSNTHGHKVGTHDTPTTRFPDFRDDMPPRSCVIAIEAIDRRPIGS